LFVWHVQVFGVSPDPHQGWEAITGIKTIVASHPYTAVALALENGLVVGQGQIVGVGMPGRGAEMYLTRAAIGIILEELGGNADDDKIA
jgi:hypothetical protein